MIAEAIVVLALGSALKPPAPPPVKPAAPVVNTAPIRLFGMKGKDEPKIAALVATAPLQLWGASAPPGAVVATAALVLVGPVPGPMKSIATEPIRLWGGP